MKIPSKSTSLFSKTRPTNILTEQRPREGFQDSSFFSASRFLFSPDIFKKVRAVYDYLRKADEYVDQPKQEIKAFKTFRIESEKALKSNTYVSEDPVIKRFMKVARHNDFDPEWTIFFLDSMESDLTKKRYKNKKELDIYIKGSAKVVGLYMVKILHLPKESYEFAEALGDWMQRVNILRDIGEDARKFGRVYLPEEHLSKYNLNIENILKFSLNKDSFSEIELNHFKELIRYEIDECQKLYEFAQKGFKYIPSRYLLAIRTASDKYTWLSKKIEKNPQWVLYKKLKQPPIQFIPKVFKNFLSLKNNSNKL